MVRAKTKAINNDSNWGCLLVSPTRLALCGVRRELLEHLRHTFIEVLFVLIGLVGQHVFGGATPNQLFGFSVVHVDNQGTLFVILFRCRRLAEAPASESSPAPSSAEAVVEGL